MIDVLLASLQALRLCCWVLHLSLHSRIIFVSHFFPHVHDPTMSIQILSFLSCPFLGVQHWTQGMFAAPRVICEVMINVHRKVSLSLDVRAGLRWVCILVFLSVLDLRLLFDLSASCRLIRLYYVEVDPIEHFHPTFASSPRISFNL